MKKRALFAFVTTVLTIQGLTACGKKLDSTAKTATNPSIAIPAASNGQIPQSTLPGTTTDANAQTTVANYPFFGTYKGTVLRLSYGSQIGLQNYVITIGKTPVPGSSDIYLTLNFTTSGASGSLNKTTYLGAVTGAGSGTYIFVSQPLTMEGWSNRTQVMEIYMAFGAGNALIPSQSRIYMRECGFSDSTVCTNLSSDIGFGLDLIKF